MALELEGSVLLEIGELSLCLGEERRRSGGGGGDGMKDGSCRSHGEEQQEPVESAMCRCAYHRSLTAKSSSQRHYYQYLLSARREGAARRGG